MRVFPILIVSADIPDDLLFREERKVAWEESKRRKYRLRVEAEQRDAKAEEVIVSELRQGE